MRTMMNESCIYDHDELTRVWTALGVTSYTGKSASEHVTALLAERDRLKNDLHALRQQVEDTIAVAETETDADGFISAYHFKTGAIHRLLAMARKGDGSLGRPVITPRLQAFHHRGCGYKDQRYNGSWECTPECLKEQENYMTSLAEAAATALKEGE